MNCLHEQLNLVESAKDAYRRYECPDCKNAIIIYKYDNQWEEEPYEIEEQ